MINKSVVYSLIRNGIILKGISRGGHYYNDHIFVPRNEDGYRDYRYYFPNLFTPRKSVSKDVVYSIRENREEGRGCLMDKCRSNQVKLLWERLQYVDKMRELIILLSDDDLYLFRSYLLEEGITKEFLSKNNRQEIWYKNYFSADFYLPYYRTIIELDSNSYHEFPGVDRARDRMIESVHGIKTVRFFRYDKNPAAYESILLNLLNNPLPDPYIFNQLDLLVENYLVDHREMVEELDRRISLGNRDPLKSLLV